MANRKYIETIAKRGYRFKEAVANPSVSIPERAETVRWSRFTMRSFIGAIAILAATAFLLRSQGDKPAPPPLARLALIPPQGVAVENAQISPDGRRIAFIGREGETHDLEPSTRRVWIQALDTTVAVPVPGTEGALAIFWAPDSEQFAFEAPTLKLKKVSVHGGAPQTLCDAWNVAGTWSRAGVIVFQSGALNGPGAGDPAASNQGLFQVPASGGPPTAVTTLDSSRRELRHLWPHFLPDGRHFLYVIHSAEKKWSGLYAGSLDSPEITRVLEVETAAAYVSPGYLLFSRDGALMAQRFDATGLKLTGEASPIASDADYQSRVGVPQFSTSPRVVPGFPARFTIPLLGTAIFSASESGLVAYSLDEPYQFQFGWVDRHGGALGDVGSPGPFRTFDLSSDAKRLIVTRPKIDRANLWIVDLDRNVTSQLTFGPSFEFDPRWAPDRQSVTVTALSEDAGRRIVQIGLDGKTSVTLKSNVFLDSWSSDGRFLLYRPAGDELRALPLNGDRQSFLIRRAPAARFDQAQLSSDSRWIAYGSNESGEREVYVERFPPTGERWQVSPDGGVQPVWRRDGRELYYLRRDGTLFAVEFRAEADSKVGIPVPLFHARVGQVSWDTEQYATIDGSRFLVMNRIERPQRPITVIVNWQAPLQVPAR
jgi:hypothetical protein